MFDKSGTWRMIMEKTVNNILYEAIVLVLLCLAGISLSGDFIEPVIIFVIALCAAMITQLFKNSILNLIILAGLSLSCGWFPQMFCMIPLIVYISMWEKKWYLPLFSLIVFRRLGDGSLVGTQYLIAIIGAVIALLLYYRLSVMEDSNRTLRKLRDEVYEKNELLAAQNERLSQAQDNEIYLATLKERNRIAREIHDNVGHMLTRSLLQAGALIVANKDENLKEPLENLKDTLDQAMTSVRSSVHDLHDESVDLKSLLTECISPAENKFDVTFKYDMSNKLPTIVTTGFAGIVKEAVNNAIRHSTGDSLNITALEHPGFYELNIEDNGRVISYENKSTGIGLDNMRERTKEMKGKIDIQGDENGFKVSVHVPK